jgi:hypothetical protein
MGDTATLIEVTAKRGKHAARKTCLHNSINNAIRLYLLFENTGLDHEVYCVTGLTCADCNEPCTLVVTKWNYTIAGLEFEIASTPKKGKELKYVHYPAVLAAKIEAANPSDYGKLGAIIVDELPSRLTQWVWKAFMDGNNLHPDHYVEDPKEAFERFWKSLVGYSRKILKMEKSPVWV